MSIEAVQERNTFIELEPEIFIFNCTGGNKYFVDVCYEKVFDQISRKTSGTTKNTYTEKIDTSSEDYYDLSDVSEFSLD